MPGFYENLIVQQKSPLTKIQYVEACVLYQQLYGRLRYSALKGAISFLLGAMFTISIFTGGYFPEDQILEMALLAVVSIAGFGWLTYYFLYGQKKIEIEWAGKVFDSSPLPGISQEISVYRDSFEIKSEYGSMTGFWSECGGCCRKGEMLIVDTSSNLSRNMLVFRKPAMRNEEYEALCRHFESVFFKKYTVRGGK